MLYKRTADGAVETVWMIRSIRSIKG